MKEAPSTWTCRKCGPLTPGQFYVCKHGDGIRIKCRSCSKAALAERKKAPGVMAADQRRWRQAHPEESRRRQTEKYSRNRDRYLASMKEVRRKRRAEVLARYGLGDPKCALCGDPHEEFLVIDHVDGGGNRHRKELKLKSDGFYRWLIKQGFPSGFRVLCHCCNNALGSYGRAPERSYGPLALPDPGRTAQARYGQRQRIACLRFYGNGDPRCACCGLSNYEYLAVDHVDGGGREHRREAGIHGKEIYPWLVRQGFPDGYRILCHNCNFSLGAHGRCPHQEHEEHVSSHPVKHQPRLG